LCVTDPVICPGSADIVLTLDQSTSIVQESAGGMSNWNVAVLGFAKSIAGAFPIGQSENSTQVGVMKFNQTAEVVFHMDRYVARKKTLRLD